MHNYYIYYKIIIIYGWFISCTIIIFITSLLVSYSYVCVDVCEDNITKFPSNPLIHPDKDFWFIHLINAKSCNFQLAIKYKIISYTHQLLDSSFILFQLAISFLLILIRMDFDVPCNDLKNVDINVLKTQFHSMYYSKWVNMSNYDKNTIVQI